MDPTQVTLPWFEIGKLALSAGLATAVFNQLIGWLREWRKEHDGAKRAAQYTAVRLAVILEEFVLDCANCLADQNLHESSAEHAGSLHTRLPPLRAYPDDLDWKSLNSALAARTLTLRVEISFAQKSVALMWEATADPDSVAHEWDLAENLRSRYGFPPFERAHRLGCC
jgi:hypothetical protein